jgi:hypothetical protein
MQLRSALVSTLLLASPFIAQAQTSVHAYKAIPCPALPHEWRGMAVGRLTNADAGGYHMLVVDMYEFGFIPAISEGKWASEGLRGLTYAENFDPEFMGPVFRLCFKDSANHMYTMDPAERDQLLHQGWVQEQDLGFLVYPDKIDAFRAKYQVPAHHSYPWSA